MLEVIPKGVRFDGCTLIAGFHGIGATGYWSVKYMIQQLKVERAAFIDSEYIAPVAAVQGGKLTTPHELARKGDLVFLKIDVPLYRDFEVKFYRELAQWVVGAGFREVALIGGLDASLKVDDSTHRIVHTSAYSPAGKLADSQVLEDDHVIVGPVAILLNYFEAMKFPAYAVLSYASTERADPRAASAAIALMSGVYGFSIDTSALMKGAEVLESDGLRDEPSMDKRSGDSMYT
ncbi:MAG TPA: PAC2 family protein [Conexivisphaerales archaeon]|nr:PAC2 family protein [Conexivisphaerales archaeon]